MELEQAIRTRLGAHPRLWIAGRKLKGAIRHPLVMAKRASQRADISRYLKAHDSPRVILGAGPHRRQGWLSTDVVPASSAAYLDATRPFPFPDASIAYYHAEHVIEHIGYHAALSMVKEMRRTLRPGGIARIATPDLGKVAALVGDLAEIDREYVERTNASWSRNPDAQVNGSLPVPHRNRSCFVINRLFYGWGHRFVFDRATLGDLLELAGFTSQSWFRAGESDDPALEGIESHGTTIEGFINDYETMVVQAS